MDPNRNDSAATVGAWLRSTSVCALAVLTLGCPQARDADNWPGAQGVDTGGEASTDDDSQAASETSGSRPDDGGDPESTTESGGDAGLKLDVGNGDDGSGDGGDPADCECAPGLDAIYLLSEDSELWVYHPDSNEFDLVAALSCEQDNSFSGSTFSMGVSRDGLAWVQYAGGNLYTVDVNDPAACDATAYQAGLFGNFGMSFVSKSAANPCDQIYAHNFALFGPGVLAKIDPDTLQRVEVQNTEYSAVELTGTGDGRLFGLVMPLDGSDSSLVEFDKAGGPTLGTRTLDGLHVGDAFAVAFYGGDFYFFTGQLGGSSQVWHLDYDDSDAGALTQVRQAAPITVVGAGTSTCVPFEPEG